jgi:hypothetical protein
MYSNYNFLNYCNCRNSDGYKYFPKSDPSKPISGSYIFGDGSFVLNEKEENKKGWICPLCGRGVSPDVKYCDHGEVELEWSFSWS